ncbi:MAG TPA: IclR family transcriptional regulator [Chloroflexota bacterium]|nr:IclR family transcriptional regulator [Chloroflexota bacterium]
MTDSVPTQSSVRSVERTLDLLMMLEQAAQPMRLSELARAAGIHVSTAQRLLSVLERRGLVDREAGRYRVGVAAVPLAHAFFLENDLTKAALPVLQDLAVGTEETASMFVRLGFNRVVVQRVEGKHPLRYVLPVGQRLPLHLGAGKVLAAAMPQEELEEMLDQVGTIRRVTGEVWEKELFLAELQRIRQQGFAVSMNERTFGVASVTAAIRHPDGSTVAALSVVGPAESVTQDRIPQLSVEVRRAAQAISEITGSHSILR